jgi:hypothetical protein
VRLVNGGRSRRWRCSPPPPHSYGSVAPARRGQWLVQGCMLACFRSQIECSPERSGVVSRSHSHSQSHISRKSESRVETSRQEGWACHGHTLCCPLSSPLQFHPETIAPCRSRRRPGQSQADSIDCPTKPGSQTLRECLVNSKDKDTAYDIYDLAHGPLSSTLLGMLFICHRMYVVAVQVVVALCIKISLRDIKIYRDRLSSRP